MDNSLFDFTTWEEVLQKLSQSFKKRRLEKGLTRAKLQSISGIPAPTIARFETTSRISLEAFVRLAMVLGYEEELLHIFREPKYNTLLEMETIKSNKNRKRGTRKPC